MYHPGRTPVKGGRGRARYNARNVVELPRKVVRNLLRLNPLELLVVVVAGLLYLPVFGVARLLGGVEPRARDGGFWPGSGAAATDDDGAPRR